MRVSTNYSHQVSVNGMLDQQSKLTKTQAQLSSGKQLSSPSDDPVAASRILELKQSVGLTEQYQDNISTARNRLTQEETALQNATEMLHRIKDLAIQGMNETSTPAGRDAIAEEISQLKKELLGVANKINPNGEYIFSGYQTKTQPFDKTGANYDYHGDENQRLIQIGPDRTVEDGNHGVTLFGQTVADGGTGTLFDNIDTLVADLNTNSPVLQSLEDLDAGMERIITTKSSIGARMNALDVQEELNSDYVFDTTSTLSEIEDLDFAEAISRFNIQTLSLQAAQQAYTKVKSLSLFNYL